MVKFHPVDKECEDPGDGKHYTSWWLAESMREQFPGGATMSEIYHKILGPKNLTASDTALVVRNALSLGYLKRGSTR